jgi:Caspase domain
MHPHSRPRFLAALALALAAPLPARAAPADAPPDPDLDAFAIVVGSNAGGAGQTDLRFAEDDARRVADVLGDLGGYDRRRIAIVVRPSPDAVMAAIDRVAEEVAAARAAGRRSLVFFYYSGHAKASALDLGAGELPLARLREKIVGLPATLTVVVLDACQSGAFSRVKGSEPAADFSFNSKARLDATGIAVMASSSESELSQESDTLRSSYFTHHLLVGLRGAGDSNGDGRVSLDEAYRYAYHQTLLATAQTAVGEQHVSLEVDLKGQGEVPLTYPARATARIALRADLAGDVVVEKVPAQAVVAELVKARGAPVRIAVAPGQYRVLVHHDRVVDRCAVDAAPGAAAELGACDTVPEVSAATKGPGDVAELSLELSLALGGGVDDAYTKRLRDFGYKQELGAPGVLGVAVLSRVHPQLATGIELDSLLAPAWKRDTELQPLRFRYTVTALSPIVRAGHQLSTHTWAYAQAGLGLARGHDELTDETGQIREATYWSYAVSVAGGLTWAPLRPIGFTLRGSYVHAPAVDNLVGDTHDAGGLFVGFGLEIRP